MESYEMDRLDRNGNNSNAAENNNRRVAQSMFARVNTVELIENDPELAIWKNWERIEKTCDRYLLVYIGLSIAIPLIIFIVWLINTSKS